MGNYPAPILKTRSGVCYLCKRRGDTALHHILYGPLRGASTANGFYVFLCPDCHQYAPESVHRCIDTDMVLRRRCQRAFEKNHTRKEWMAIAHRNYL